MKGTGVSPGISIGKAFIINKFKASVSGIKLKTEESKIVEIRNFDNAVHASVSEIETMKVSKGTDLRQADIDILETQIEFLNDPQIKSDVTDKINDEDATAWDAVIKVIEGAVKMFREMDDEYMSARAADIQDVGNRILRHLDFNESPTTGDLCENSIIIADDIAPSDTISLDISKVTGFATRLGGKTSHTAIIAKGKGIPAVVACGDELLNIRNNDFVILDGTTGEVIVNPDQGQKEEYL
ncbi:MAG TPA: phosphoenolpyruvate-utilizing N-terminal domain-containing protein, partial [Bacteroidales bacterium]|nr:phosphoenolpyruvate-utilizing N-terminal domain-containing protein [Bacteroidales bacterium]